MKLYMSNKSKNVGTVAKAKMNLQSVDPFSIVAIGLAHCTFCSLHFTVVCVSCRSVGVCLQQCYGIRIYRLGGVVALSLLSETTVDKYFLCSKISRDTNYALSLRQYTNRVPHHNGSRDIIAILSERIILNTNVREMTLRLCKCKHIVH